MDAPSTGNVAGETGLRRPGSAQGDARSRRIAQVVGHFGGGGAERVAANLALALQQAGHELACIALRDGQGFPALTDRGVDERSLGIGSGFLTAHRGFRAFRHLVRDKRFDLVWVHGSSSLVFCQLALTGLEARPQVWFTWHNSEEVLGGGWLRRVRLCWAISRCDRVFGPSSSVVDRLRQALPIADRVQVFRNGVPELPMTTGLDADEPLIVWASRFVPPKDPQILVRAAARLKSEGLRFRMVMAGSALPHLGWFYDQTRQLARDLSVDDLIDFPGWMDDLPVLYRNAAIGVQTSHTEGLSMTLLEQMMCGLAIVATEVGDTATAIRGDRGILIPPADEQALTNALRTLVTDIPRRLALARAARQAAIEEFSLSAMARQVVDLLHR